MTGDTARAESLVQDLEKRFPPDTQIQSLWLPAIQAQLALDNQKPASALDSLQGATAIELGQFIFINNISCLYHIYIRGDAYLAAGQGSAAVAEFQKILDHSGIVWNCWTGALAHLGVARANALQAKNSQVADANAARVGARSLQRFPRTLERRRPGHSHPERCQSGICEVEVISARRCLRTECVRVRYWFKIITANFHEPSLCRFKTWNPVPCQLTGGASGAILNWDSCSPHSHAKPSSI